MITRLIGLVPAVLRRNPLYRRIFLSEFVSTLGTSMSTLAFPLLVLATGGSAVQAGSIATVALGTRLAFRLPAGSLADRWDPRRVMVATDLVRLLALGSLPVVALTGEPDFAQMIAVAAVEGLAGALFGPAAGLMTRDVTATDSQLTEAMGLGQVVQAGTSLLGPALGGSLFVIDPMLPFLLDAASYALSALLLAGVSRPATAIPAAADRGGVTAGIRWLLTTRPLLLVLVFCGVINLVGGAMELLVVIDLRLHGATGSMVGLTMSCAGIGAVAGSVLALPVTRRLRVPSILLGLGATWALAFTALAMAFSPALAAGLLTTLMVLSPAAGVVVGTTVLGGTPRHLLGRVNAATSLMLMGLAVLGPITAGALVQWVGASGAWTVLAAVTAALTALIWKPLRQAWSADASPPNEQPDCAEAAQPEVLAHLAPDAIAPLVPADPLLWLEQRDDPRTQEWSRDRAAEFDRATADWTHRDHFATEIERLTQVNSPVSTPRPAGGRLFVEWHPTGAEHPAIAVIEPGGPVRTLLDPHRLDPTGRTTLEAWHPSTDGRLLAYQVAAGGTENAQLWVLDVGTGTVVDGPISRVRNSTVAWLPDGLAFYYVRRPDPADRPGKGQYHRRVRLHRIGADPEHDPVVFGQGRRSTEHYAVRTDPDGRWLVVSASAGTDPRKDLWIADLRSSDPAAPQFRVMHEGIDARTRPNPRPDGIYALTDLGADRNRLVRCPPGAPEPRSWTDLVPEDPDAVLDDYAVLDDPGLPRPLLLVRRVRHAVGELTVHDLREGTLLNVVALPGNCSIGQLRAEAAGADAAWFGVTGFDHPTTVYRFDAHTGLAAPWTPPGGIETHEAQTPDGPPIRTRQLTYPSADGTPVRLFVVAADPHDPQTPRPPTPTILMAYGGFGQSTTPSHAPDVAAWVRAGGVYAIAAVRGGGEEGRAWHRAGLLAGKQTSIDDLNAAAQHLVDLGLTTPGQLGVWGASNGGLLAGGALTQHPERYGAVACVAALLDMVRYQQSGLGPSWVGEYGDAADPEQLAWLRAYSPYHRVREGQAYPAVLLAVFEADTRVDPLHARKMGEALRRAGSGARPVLLRSEAHAGHGTRSRSSLTALQADLLAFFAHELGLRSPARGSSQD